MDRGFCLRGLRVNAGIALDGAADHGVSEARYLRDPDGNGVERYGDRPMENWPRTPEGGLAIFTKALDLDALLAAAEPRSSAVAMTALWGFAIRFARFRGRSVFAGTDGG